MAAIIISGWGKIPAQQLWHAHTCQIHCAWLNSKHLCAICNEYKQYTLNAPLYTLHLAFPAISVELFLPAFYSKSCNIDSLKRSLGKSSNSEASHIGKYICMCVWVCVAQPIKSMFGFRNTKKTRLGTKRRKHNERKALVLNNKSTSSNTLKVFCCSSVVQVTYPVHRLFHFCFAHSVAVAADIVLRAEMERRCKQHGTTSGGKKHYTLFTCGYRSKWFISGCFTCDVAAVVGGLVRGLCKEAGAGFIWSSFLLEPNKRFASR